SHFQPGPPIAQNRDHPDEALGCHVPAHMELDPFGWLGIDLDLGRVEQTSRQSEPELPLKSVRGATGEKASVCDDRFATDAHGDLAAGRGESPGREQAGRTPTDDDDVNHVPWSSSWSGSAAKPGAKGLTLASRLRPLTYR